MIDFTFCAGLRDCRLSVVSASGPRVLLNLDTPRLFAQLTCMHSLKGQGLRQIEGQESKKKSFDFGTD
jgi:hypothetical protein